TIPYTTLFRSDQQADQVLSDRLVDLAFKGLEAVVERIDFLNGPGEPELEAGVGDAAGIAAEGGDDRHLGLADLEGEQHAEEDQQQHAAGDQRDLVLFHKVKIICS